jgi:hypothetical protein
MNVTRGMIILTVLLLSTVVSFFMGRILGNELMNSGKEQLGDFIDTQDADAENEPILAGHTQPAYEYEGPTTERFPLSEGTIPDTNPSGSAAVTIEPVDSSGGDQENSDIFSLDEGSLSEDTQRLFRIQIGVFALKQNAEDLMADLRKESFSAYIQEVEYNPGEVYWKVYVGPFQTQEAANEVADDLRERNYDAHVR